MCDVYSAHKESSIGTQLGSLPYTSPKLLLHYNGRVEPAKPKLFTIWKIFQFLVKLYPPVALQRSGTGVWALNGKLTLGRDFLGSDTQAPAWMCLTQQMVREGGHTGGREGQFFFFPSFHGPQQEANTLFRGRRLPSIKTWAYTDKGHLVICVRTPGGGRAGKYGDVEAHGVGNRTAVVKKQTRVQILTRLLINCS